MEDVEYRIGKLSMAPGDVLVVKVDTNLTQGMAQRIKAQVEPSLPHGVKAMVIDRNIELSALSVKASLEG